MKTRTVVCTWESTHTVELPDDYEPGDALDEEWTEQIDSSMAELTDWSWRRR